MSLPGGLGVRPDAVRHRGYRELRGEV